MNWLTRVIASCRKPPAPDKIDTVRPRVTPNPADAEALERRFGELAYSPENGFHRDNIQRCRQNVVLFRRRGT